MKKLEYWEITQNADSTEGRGPSVATGFAATSKKVAPEIVKSPEYGKRFGVMGTKGNEYDVRECVVLVVDSFQEFCDALPISVQEKARLRALSKLNDEDRKVLGLT